MKLRWLLLVGFVLGGNMEVVDVLTREQERLRRIFESNKNIHSVVSYYKQDNPLIRVTCIYFKDGVTKYAKERR